jgi:hypothetical protein
VLRSLVDLLVGPLDAWNFPQHAAPPLSGPPVDTGMHISARATDR